MFSRRTMLGLSISIAFVMEAAFLALAPMIPVLGENMVPERVMKTFRVKIRQVEPEPPEPQEAEDERSELVTRPGSIEDLLDWDKEMLEPSEDFLDQQVDVPLLAERIASEELEREHNLDPEPAALERVDAKVIEIAQDTARQDIEIARRLVQPSSNRILQDGEYPILRVPGESLEPTLTAPAGASILGRAAAPPGTSTAEAEEVPETPPYEEHTVEPEPAPEKKVEPLPEEKILARAPVLDEIKQENTYDFMDDLVEMKLDTFVPSNEEKGFFRLRIVPKKGETIPVLPKDVTFVIDASNSIVQHKLDNTVKGVRQAVSKLRAEDRFNIVIFRDTATHFQPDLVNATDQNKAAALEFLRDQESYGETDVYNAMRPVVEASPREGTPGIVMVMTDGRPTTGVRDARIIINSLTADRNPENTIFAYGGGNTVNRYLLDLLAYRNKGESYVSDGIGDIQQDIPAFFDTLTDPILVDLDADFGQIDEASVVPADVPDFYKGRAVTVYGRYDPKEDDEFVMRLVGRSSDSKKEIIFKENLKEAASGDEEIARKWAFERIYSLIGEICRVGETPELLNEIRELSRKYDIRTSYDE